MNLGKVLSNWRYLEKKSIREAAALFGVSPSTLGRIENGKNVDGETLSKILKWLLSGEEATAAKQVKEQQEETA